MKKKKDQNKLSFREAFKRNYRAFLLVNKSCPGMFFSSFLYGAVSAVIPYVGIYFSAQIINELAGNRNPEVIWKWVWITIAVTTVLALLKALVSRYKVYRQSSWWQNINTIYNNKLLRMDFCVLDEQHTHDLYSQIRQNSNWGGWGLNRIIWSIFEPLVNAIVSIISGIALTVSLFALPVPEKSSLAFLNSPVFLLIFLAVLLGITFLSPFCANKADNYWVKASEYMKYGNRIFGFFGYEAHDRSRALDMRMYNQQDICQSYLKNPQLSFISRYAKGPMGGLMALSAAVSTAFTGFAYLFVCLKAWAGAFAVGSVTQYIGAITALSKGVSDLMRTVGDIKNNASFLQTTFEFLDLPDRMYQGSLTTEKRSDRNYEVEFRDVSFRYPQSENYALKHVSLKFRIGERLAVVGPNGSGKTTFIKLLCRLYDPTEGEILLNGIDIKKYNYDQYREIFSVVFQDFQLFSFPLGQNVAAKENYDPKRAEECLIEAGFGDRLSRMPQGLDTCLYKDFDENGVEISGGEAQKIAIARALYKDAPFIILDEPTAALDPVAEYEVYSKFNEIAGDKTAVYISHRLSSCRFCDEIAVFQDGALVQKGSHDELVKDASGEYYQLWQSQAQYYV